MKKKIPLSIEILADMETPLSVYKKLGNGPFSYLFESVEGGEKWARYSLIGLPSNTLIKVSNDKVTIIKNKKVVEEFTTEDPLKFIEEYQSKIEVEFRHLENERIKAFSEQGLDVTCPVESCNTVTFVPIIVNYDNEYECPKCNAEIKIYLGTKCFLKTTPVKDDPFDKHNFVTNTDYEQE